uniref:Uncharacterized protein n=1 Tax=Anguilla anguilla TaxID=7936 RepID=A0A0E9UZ21_ANGAN
MFRLAGQSASHPSRIFLCAWYIQFCKAFPGMGPGILLLQGGKY